MLAAAHAYMSKDNAAGAYPYLHVLLCTACIQCTEH